MAARVSITEDEELAKDPIMKPFIEALPYATSYFYVSESDDRQIMLDAIDSVILQGVDSKTAAGRSESEGAGPAGRLLEQLIARNAS